jgi:hypothetical protein
MDSNKHLVLGLINLALFLHLGFTCSRADSSLFIFQTHTTLILLLVYVDDISVLLKNKTFEWWSEWM